MSCLRKAEIGGKGQQSIHAVNLQSISHDAWQAAAQNNHQWPMSIGGWVASYRSRTKGSCIGRKQEAIFESGAWTYIKVSTFCVIRDAHILCFAGLSTGGSHWQQWQGPWIRHVCWPGAWAGIIAIVPRSESACFPLNCRLYWKKQWLTLRGFQQQPPPQTSP